MIKTKAANETSAVALAVTLLFAMLLLAMVAGQQPTDLANAPGLKMILR